MSGDFFMIHCGDIFGALWVYHVGSLNPNKHRKGDIKMAWNLVTVVMICDLGCTSSYGCAGIVSGKDGEKRGGGGIFWGNGRKKSVRKKGIERSIMETQKERQQE